MEIGLSGLSRKYTSYYFYVLHHYITYTHTLHPYKSYFKGPKTSSKLTDLLHKVQFSIAD